MAPPGAAAGGRVRGYACPPATGEYVFWIAGDENAELWLSPDEDPGRSTRIASAPSSTNAREWTKFGSQRSANVYLEAGKRYYIEARHRENTTTVNDHLSVGWQLPDGGQERPIPGKRLSPFLPVQEADQSVRFYRGLNLNGEAITLEGNQWAGKSDANYNHNGKPTGVSTLRLLPATDPTREAMIRSSLWNITDATSPGLQVNLLQVPSATYLVYVYVWEDGASVTYSLSLEGQVVLSNANSGSAGSWRKLGPFRTSVGSDEVLNLVATGGGINVSGIELWQQSTAPAQPVVVEAGQDWQLPAYSPTYTVRGKVQQVYTRSLTAKRYELKDHLGNVRVVVGDQKQAHMQGNAVILSALLEGYSHYYPFGMMEPGGSYQAATASNYRYGFNGKELDKEGMGGGGSTYDYGFRIYNPNIAKFLSVDPLADDYPWYTPYQFSGNMPIEAIDLDGLEPKSNKEGFWEGVGKTVLEGAMEIVKYLEERPGAAGYGYHPNMKPVTKEQVKQHEVNWSEQLDPYKQIENFSENAVMGPVNMYQGVVNKDGRQFVKGVPQVISTIGLIAEFRSVTGLKGPKIPLRSPCGCFTAGTLVLTESGRKSIEEIKVGDLVWAYDDKSGKLALKSVIDTFSYERDTVYNILINDEIITTTSDHPFFIGGKWLKVKEVSEGDSVSFYSGKKAAIRKISIIVGSYRVYNFTVDDFHTYFVSNQDVLVHNSGPCDILERALKRQGFNSGDTYPNGFKEKWSEGGYDYEVRIHSADPNAPAGSNSAVGPVYRVARRKQGIDPDNGSGQGYGWEQADINGNWHPNSTLKPTNANYNPQAANDTHIPVPTGTIK